MSQILHATAILACANLWPHRIFIFNSLRPSDAYMRQQTNQHWLRYWLVAWSAPSHYLNQCWNIVNWTLRNKVERNFNLNSNISSKKMFSKMSSGNLRPICLGLSVLTYEQRTFLRDLGYVHIKSMRNGSQYPDKEVLILMKFEDIQFVFLQQARISFHPWPAIKY